MVEANHLPDVPHAVGMNNHMGSKLQRRMRQPSWNAVIQPSWKPRGLLFLDSVTHAQSERYRLAEKRAARAWSSRAGQGRVSGQRAQASNRRHTHAQMEAEASQIA